MSFKEKPATGRFGRSSSAVTKEMIPHASDLIRYSPYYELPKAWSLGPEAWFWLGKRIPVARIQFAGSRSRRAVVSMIIRSSAWIRLVECPSYLCSVLNLPIYSPMVQCVIWL